MLLWSFAIIRTKNVQKHDTFNKMTTTEKKQNVFNTFLYVQISTEICQRNFDKNFLNIKENKITSQQRNKASID